VGGTTLRTWTLGTSMTDYSASTNSTGDIRVAFTNDNGDRDVQVDYISVNGQVRQAEDQSENTGVWGNSACGGTGFSEWLHCNGYIGFGSITGAASSSAPLSSSSSSSSVISSSSSTTSSASNTGVTASIVIDNDWGAGYCATLRVTNNTSAPVTWNVSVTVNGTVSSLWNGSWSQSGSTLTVAGVGWNSQLQPGQTESSVGFCVSR
jgi:cellulase/cellobiase CelA1